MKIKLLILSLVSALLLHAQASEICHQVQPHWPTQANGRIKPLRVLAQDSLKFMTGKSRPFSGSATFTFCQLSFLEMGMEQKNKIEIKIDHVDVRKILGLKEDTPSLPPDLLEERSMILRQQMMKIKENNSTKKEIQKILSRLALYQEITQGKVWTFAEMKGQELSWTSLREYLTEQRVADKKEKTQRNPLIELMIDSKSAVDSKPGTTYQLEYHFIKTHYFSWALVVSILALGFIFSAYQKVGITLITASLIIQTIGMIIRILNSGRAPITNMYETVMFSGYGALVIALGLGIYAKKTSFFLGGLAYNCLCLMMMMFAHGMLDEGISPLVPVLRDNFWLSTHVTTVILSYAALALSWILANQSLIKGRFFPNSGSLNEESQLIYTAIKFGVVLLSAGIILGGVWADYSWGRFWGWDPKETWSLIVLLVYMAILHGRYSGWIPPSRFIPLTVAAFMSVLMAWFGVSYILASGLHSYGFSEGGAIFLISLFSIQAILLFVCLFKKKISH